MCICNCSSRQVYVYCHYELPPSLQLPFWLRLWISMTQQSSLRSGTRQARNATTVWPQCTTEELRRPLSSMISQILWVLPLIQTPNYIWKCLLLLAKLVHRGDNGECHNQRLYLVMQQLIVYHFITLLSSSSLPAFLPPSLFFPPSFLPLPPSISPPPSTHTLLFPGHICKSQDVGEGTPTSGQP